MATVTSETMYSTAKGYVQSAFTLITSPYRLNKNQIDTTILLSYFMLLGFALELYIKAWLVADGVQSPWGHDLDKLHSEAVSRGMPEVAGDLVAKLHHHKTFEFRYMGRDSEYAAPEIALTFRILDYLNYFVDVKTGASASMGFVPNNPETDPLWFIPQQYRAWRLLEPVSRN